MKVAIANFGEEVFPEAAVDYAAAWRDFRRPDVGTTRARLFELPHQWGFHIFSIGVRLLDLGIADHMEFWNFEPRRRFFRHAYGFGWMNFHNRRDLAAYLDRFGCPDLLVHHGGVAGRGVLQMLEGRSFRVSVPALRSGDDRDGNFDAECYLVDDPRYLDDKSMMYVPVVNTTYVAPADVPKTCDFIYLAEGRPSKRHDLIIEAVLQNGMSGHFHPVEPGAIDLRGASITETAFDSADPVELMRSARFAVYAGDRESSPASMWECVACDLPIVVNANIEGGRHVVVPGVTGELAGENEFAEVMKKVLEGIDRYRPRDYLMRHWDTVATIDRYLDFFRAMGWRA
jgi:glycosyltransferase involved in cell wall biosynthesis